MYGIVPTSVLHPKHSLITGVFLCLRFLCWEMANYSVIGPAPKRYEFPTSIPLLRFRATMAVRARGVMQTDDRKDFRPMARKYLRFTSCLRTCTRATGVFIDQWHDEFSCGPAGALFHLLWGGLACCHGAGLKLLLGHCNGAAHPHDKEALERLNPPDAALAHQTSFFSALNLLAFGAADLFTVGSIFICKLQRRISHGARLISYGTGLMYNEWKINTFSKLSNNTINTS